MPNKDDILGNKKQAFNSSKPLLTTGSGKINTFVGIYITDINSLDKNNLVKYATNKVISIICPCGVKSSVNIDEFPKKSVKHPCSDSNHWTVLYKDN